MRKTRKQRRKKHVNLKARKDTFKGPGSDRKQLLEARNDILKV